MPGVCDLRHATTLDNRVRSGRILFSPGSVILVTAFLVEADKLDLAGSGERTAAMSKTLLVAGGVLNGLFFLFHLLLGYQIQNLAQVAPPHRALMEALNVGAVLFMFFFAYVSFVHGKELLQTGVGRVVLLLVSVLYLSRAAEEFFLFKFTPTIFGACVLVGAVYIALFVIELKPESTPAAAIVRTAAPAGSGTPKARPAA